MTITRCFRQRGASMVEMAIIMSLFLALILTVMEFALAVFYAVRLSDATRIGARYAIVSNTIPQVAGKTCAELDALGFQQCDAASCSTILAKMNKLVSVKPENVEIRYACSSTGYSDTNHQIYSVTVKLHNMQYSLLMPSALGLPKDLWDITMPSFETTRLSEDLWSSGT